MMHRDDVLCLSHLRWNFLVQRPSHLMSRCARSRRVFFVEEPMFDGGPARLEVEDTPQGPVVVIPHFSRAAEREAVQAQLPLLLERLLQRRSIHRYALWYTTPAAVPWARQLSPRLAVYDCLDEPARLGHPELSPEALEELELELLTRVDLVFTASQALAEARRRLHPNVHALPSCVDAAHFARARNLREDPPDQAPIPRPRLGAFGAFDRRCDLGLVAGLAARLPQWQLVMVGPQGDRSPGELPRAKNLHWLGSKGHAVLPRYFAGWDAAMLPLACGAEGRFDGRTGAAELLAAGQAVVSTPHPDVVEPWGNRGLVKLASDPEGFAAALEAVRREDPKIRRGRADAFLARAGWDFTWERMSQLMDACLGGPAAHNEDREVVPAA